jgi:hypothetical protein
MPRLPRFARRSDAPCRPAPRHRIRGRGEHGAVAVEAAFVSILLFAVISGVVEVSMFLRDVYEVSSASRSGARVASSEPLAVDFAGEAARQVASGLDDLDPARVTGIWVYRADSSGDPVSGPGCAASCVKFTLNSAGVPNVGDGYWSGRNACAGTAVDSVGVRVEYRHNSLFGVLDERSITERTVMRLEQIPSTSPCVSS